MKESAPKGFNLFFIYFVMSNSGARWLDQHQKKLEASLREGKSTKEITEVFSGIFKYPTINARAIKTRKALGIVKKKTPPTNG